jgi:UDP-galactopyranose mutase
MSNYDYLIVGAGLFGAIFAHEATKRGKRCLVIERRDHVGGNVYTENANGINVHKYVPHIFHTSKKESIINRRKQYNNRREYHV